MGNLCKVARKYSDSLKKTLVMTQYLESPILKHPLSRSNSNHSPHTGDFVVARGKSWIVERAERTGPVNTLHLVSCEDDSQGETLQLAMATELETRVIDPNDWSPLLSKTFDRS
jgi:hypothetical protein